LKLLKKTTAENTVPYTQNLSFKSRKKPAWNFSNWKGEIL